MPDIFDTVAAETSAAGGGDIFDKVATVPQPRLVAIKDYKNLRYEGRAGRGTSYAPLLNDIHSAADQLGFTLGISSAYRPGAITTSGHKSRHSFQHAVDISTINGVPVTSPAGKVYGDTLAAKLHAMGFETGEHGTNKGLLWQTNVGGNHFNHLHVSYPSEEGQALDREARRGMAEGRLASSQRLKYMPSVTPPSAAKPVVKPSAKLPARGNIQEAARPSMRAYTDTDVKAINQHRQQVDRFTHDWLRGRRAGDNAPASAVDALAQNPHNAEWLARLNKMAPVSQMAILEESARRRAIMTGYDPDDPVGFAKAQSEIEGGVKGFLRGNVAEGVKPTNLALMMGFGPAEKGVQAAAYAVGKRLAGRAAAVTAARAVPRVAGAAAGGYGAAIFAPQAVEAYREGDYPRAAAAATAAGASLFAGGAAALGRVKPPKGVTDATVQGKQIEGAAAIDVRTGERGQVGQGRGVGQSAGVEGQKPSRTRKAEAQVQPQAPQEVIPPEGRTAATTTVTLQTQKAADVVANRLRAQGNQVTVTRSGKEWVVRGSHKAAPPLSTPMKSATAFSESPHPPPAKPLWEMGYDELDALHTRAKTADDTELATLFGGKEGAQRYKRLLTQENSTDRAKADAASAERERMEGKLTEEQRNRLFGIGKADHEIPEVVANYRRALGDLDYTSPEALGRSLRYAITKVGEGTDPAKMTETERLAYAQLREGFEFARSKGWNQKVVSDAALSGAMKRFTDPEDAAFMLQRFLRPAEANTSAPIRAIEPPKPAKPGREPAKFPKGKQPEQITAAAYRPTPDTPPLTGTSHPAILQKQLGYVPEQLQTAESRNLPEFGFIARDAKGKERFVSREEAAQIATKSGQDLKEFEAGEPAHSDEIATPGTQTPISETGAGKEPWQMTRQEWIASGKWDSAANAAYNTVGGRYVTTPEVQSANAEARARQQQLAQADPSFEKHQWSLVPDENGRYYRLTGFGPGGKTPTHIYAPKAVQSALEARTKALDALGEAKRNADLAQDEKAHRLAIQQAVSEGKSVPPEVLADYPDLFARQKETGGVQIKPAAPQPAEAPTKSVETPKPAEGGKTPAPKASVDEVQSQINKMGNAGKITVTRDNSPETARWFARQVGDVIDDGRKRLNLTDAQIKGLIQSGYGQYVKAAGLKPQINAKAFVAEVRTRIGDEPAAPAEAKPAVRPLEDHLAEIERAAAERLRVRRRGAQSGIDPADLADLAVWGAARLARGTIEFGKWSAEMVKEFGEEIKPHLRAIYAAAHDYYNKEIVPRYQRPALELPAEKTAPKTVKPEGDYATGARKAITIPERESRGLSPVEMQLYEKYGPAYTKGREAVEAGSIDPRKLADEVATKPRVMQPHETGALTYDRMRLNNALTTAYKEADEALARGDTPVYDAAKKRVGELLDALDTNDQALRRGGREASAALASFKQTVKEDYSLGTLLQKRRVKEGRPLTSEETDQVKALKGQLDQAQVRLDQHQTREAALEARIKELEAQKTQRAAPRVTDPRKPEFGKQNTVFTREKYEAAKRRFTAKVTGSARALPDPTIIPELVEMGGYWLEGGVRAFGDWVKVMKSEAPGASDEALQATWKELTNDKRLAAAKKRLEKQTAELKRKVAEKETAPAVKPPPIEFDAEGAKLMAARDSAKAELDKMVQAEQPVSMWEKARRLHREFILSGFSVIQKLAGATAWGYPTETASDVIAAGQRRLIPGYTRLAEISGREGAPFGTAMRGAVKGARALVSRTAVKNAWDTIRYGVNDISTLAGVKPKGMELGGYVGRFHGAEKAFLQTAEFNRSGLIRTEMAVKAGKNLSDPEVQAQVFRDSAIDAWNNILQGENRMSVALNSAMGAIERQSPLAGYVAHTLVPITRVSANIVGRGVEMTGVGIPRGVYLQVKAAMRERAGIEITPQQATAILKAYKYGGLGLVAAYLGWNQPAAFQSGGWYTPAKKQQGQLGLAQDELRIGGVHVPAILAHSPFVLGVQFWATMRQAYDRGGAPSALADVTRGISEQTPGIEATRDVAKATMESEAQMGKTTGAYFRGLTQPQIMQQTAKWLDGQAQRAPRGFIEEQKVGIPGLRQQVPVKGAKPASRARSAPSSDITKPEKGMLTEPSEFKPDRRSSVPPGDFTILRRAG